MSGCGEMGKGLGRGGGCGIVVDDVMDENQVYQKQEILVIEVPYGGSVSIKIHSLRCVGFYSVSLYRVQILKTLVVRECLRKGRVPRHGFFLLQR